MSFGSRLRSAREAKGYTQQSVADMLGISKSTYSGYETGKREPDVFRIKALSEVLDISADTLVGTKQTPRAFELSKKETDHITKYRGLDSHGQKMVDFVLNEEHERCTQPENPVIELVQEPKEIVDLYEFLAPVSAGFGVDLSDIDGAVQTKVISNVYTKQADFILRVDGESMAPRFHHMDKLLVQETDDIEVGEIGIWYVNGKHYVKKKGEGKLISLNRMFPDVYPDEVYEQKCQGRVVGVLDPSWIVEENVEE